MTLQLPPELAGILDWLGMQWPQFDEDKGYEAAQAWSDAIAQLVQNAEQGNAAAQSVNFAVQSTTSQAFNDYWDKWTGSADAYYGGAATHAQQVAALLIDASDNAQWAKVNIIAQLAVLAIVIARDVALAFITDGLSLAEMFIEAGITRELIARILDSIVMGVLMTTLPDAVTDVVELVQGRMTLNAAAWERLGGDVLQGAAFGVVGGLANEALGATLAEPLRDLAGKALSTLPGDLAESPVVNRLADQGVKTVLGAAGGAVGNSLFNAAVYGVNALSGDGRNGDESFGQAVLGGLEQGARYGVVFSLLPTRSEPDTVTGNLADGTAFSGKVGKNGVAEVTTADGQNLTFAATAAAGQPPEPRTTTGSEDLAPGTAAAPTEQAVSAVVATDDNANTANTANTADTAEPVAVTAPSAAADTQEVDQAPTSPAPQSAAVLPEALHGAVYQVTDPSGRQTVAVAVDDHGNASVIGSTVADRSGTVVSYDADKVQTSVTTDLSKVAPGQVSAESDSLYQSLTGKDTRVTLTAEGHITQVDADGRSDYYAVGDEGSVRTGSSVVGPDNTVTHYDAEGTPLYTVDSHGKISVVVETQPVRELISEPLDKVADPLVTHAPQELSAQARTEDARVLVAQSATAPRGEGRTVTADAAGRSAAASGDKDSGASNRSTLSDHFDRLLNTHAEPSATGGLDPGASRSDVPGVEPARPEGARPQDGTDRPDGSAGPGPGDDHQPSVQGRDVQAHADQRAVDAQRHGSTEPVGQRADAADGPRPPERDQPGQALTAERAPTPETRMVRSDESDANEAAETFLLLCTEYSAKRGGVVVFNRALADALADAGHNVYVRIGEDASQYADLQRPNLRILGPKDLPAPTVDAAGRKVAPDPRKFLGPEHDPENMPEHVDYVVGHTRFSGPDAKAARDANYPDAKLIHFVHMVPEALGRVKENGDPPEPGEAAKGIVNHQIERNLVRDADLAAGVGPAITANVREMVAQARDLAKLPGEPPVRTQAVHELIPRDGVPGPPAAFDGGPAAQSAPVRPRRRRAEGRQGRGEGDRPAE